MYANNYRLISGSGNKCRSTTAGHDKETAILKKAYDDFCEGVAKDTRTLYQSENVIARTAKTLINKKAMIGWQSGGHSNGYVPVFAIGVGAELFSGRIDNTDIPRKIASIAGYDGEM